MSETTTIEYCCNWCHEALQANKAYVLSDGSTVCGRCRGVGITLNKWNKPCKRRHSVNQPDAAAIDADAEGKE
jgi:hypothetical protein